MEPSVVVESPVGPADNRAPGNPQWPLLVPTWGYIGVCSPQWPLLVSAVGYIGVCSPQRTLL
eukprot:6254972-Lingulodinium_polyedra.AAC.1